MVLVEDARGLLEVEIVIGRHVPGQADQPVDVRPDDADLGRCRWNAAHAIDFLDRARLDLLGHAGLLDLFAQLVDLGLLRVFLAQLALNGLELLAQDVLALRLVHLGLDFGLDLALQLEDLDLMRQEGRDELQPLVDIDCLEQLLALLRTHVRAVGDHVGEQPGLGDVARGDGRLWWNGCARLDVLLDLALDGAHQRLNLQAGRGLFLEQLDAGEDERLRSDELDQAQALLALDDGAHGAVLKLDDLGDLGQGADGVQLGWVADVLRVGEALGDQRDRRAVGDGLVERLDRLVATDLEGHDHLREDDRFA